LNLEVADLRKFLLFIVLVAGVAALYSIFTDPDRREKFLGTIEGSTGVNLAADPEDIVKDAGRAVGDTADRLLKDLGDTLTDPAFHRSLERWGQDALKKLDDSQLDKMKKDLQREGRRGEGNYDAVFQEYLGEAGDL
jgi:hypothetical protein